MVRVSPLENLKASILSCQMVSSHFITILAWCDLITAGCHMVFPNLAIPGYASDREDLFQQQLPVADLVKPVIC